MPDDSCKAACHVSNLADTEAAVAEAAAHVAARMGGRTDLAIVFASGHHVPRIDLITSSIYDLLAPAALIGCTGVSVVGNDHEFENQPGLVILALALPGVELHTFSDSDIDWPRSKDDPARLRTALQADRPDLRGVLLLADPFTPLMGLLPALSEALSRSPDEAAAPMFGGIASAGRQAGDNRLLRNDEIRNGGLIGLSFLGATRIETLVSQGCRPIGRPLVITGARRNVIESLGGKPAMAAFQELAVELSDHERRLIQDKGLFVGRVVSEYREHFGRGDFLVRNVIGVDQDHGLLAVSDLVRVGQTVQFHVRDAQTAHEDLEMLLAAQQFDDPALAGLLFTCNGRGSHLFSEADHDAATIRRAMPGLPLAGFSAAGEIGPVGNSTFLHGHTASIALIRGA